MEDNESYDGIRIRYYEMWAQLELEYERQMWAYWKRRYPDGFPWDKVLKTKDGEIIGKAIFVSTVDLQDSGQYFKELWNDSKPERESGLYRLFRPAWDATIDEFGFKKEEDEEK